ncbi:MAG: FtsX-like permease family protein, partial [Woeseia sp.]
MKSRARHFLLSFAWRDLRASGPSLWVFCACLVLGVSLIVATGGLYRLISDGLLADTRQLLGGDLEIDGNEPLPNDVLAWVSERGDVSLVTEVDTMLGTDSGEFLRVELQAMDAAYPLYGTLTLSPAMPLTAATAMVDGQWGVAIDPVQAERLGIAVGDEVSIGSQDMRVRALVMNQPDRALNAEWRGAPVLLAEEALKSTGLMGTGSLADYDYRIRTDAEPVAWRAEFRAAFPDANWRVRTFEDRGRRIAERLGQLASGLMIIALSTLFIGGLGVFNSIQSYLQRKRQTIATLRALGLKERGVATIYLLQVAIMSSAASLAGAMLGGGLALMGAAVVAGELPLATTAGSLVWPVVAGLVFGLLTAFVFAMPSVGRATTVDPASLFRGMGNKLVSLPVRWLLTTAIVTVVLAGMVFAALPDKLFAL